MRILNDLCRSLIRVHENTFSLFKTSPMARKPRIDIIGNQHWLFIGRSDHFWKISKPGERFFATSSAIHV